MSELPRELIAARAQGRLVPFVGAGVSMAVTTKAGVQAFPSWWSLLDRAAQRLADEGRAEHEAVRSLLKLSEYLAAAEYAKRGLGALWAPFLGEVFGISQDTIDTASLELARSVWALGSELVVTTNYDRVLRWACPSEGDLDELTHESQAELAQLLGGTLRRKAVWHLHGSVRDAAHLILAPQDYRMLYASEHQASRHRASLDSLRTLMVQKRFLFVGFSLDDEAVVKQLEWVSETFAGCVGPHYVLVRESELAAMRGKLSSRSFDVQAIGYAAHGQPLIELVRRIAGGERAPVTVVQTSAPVHAPTAAPVLAPGKALLGRYRLIEKRGQGGFAVVWQALDLHDNRLVALKILRGDHAEDAARVERFQKGAETLRGLEHEAIAKLLSGPHHEGNHHFYVMPWYAGEDLRSALLRRGIDRNVALEACARAFEGLAHAHAQGLVHRDVTPSNVLLDGKLGLLADFDLVRDEHSSIGTRAGVGMGTFAYAAPELHNQANDANVLADVYGAAMTVLFVLLGKDPPLLVGMTEPERISEGAGDIGLEAALRGALAYKREARTTTLAGLIAAIRGRGRAPAARSIVQVPTPAIITAPPAWPQETGADAYGRWARLRVGPVVQKMRRIPPGEFVMGSPPTEEGRWEDEGPQHRVRFTKGFWLADTPCTQAFWQEIMGTTPSYFAGPNRPVEQVSWDDVQAFMRELDARVPGLRAGLPTEARWEYACRAGSQAPRYGHLQNIAWYSKNAGSQTQEIGQKQANAWGLFDMLGNVWEWCADMKADYQSEMLVDPPAQELGQERVSRGGSWFGFPRLVRAACRDGDVPGLRYESLGFRLAGGQ